MSSPATTSGSPAGIRNHPDLRPRPQHRAGTIIAAVAIAAVLACLAIVLYVRLWPFSEQSVLQDLGEASDTTVVAAKYHPTYFPPGCVLDAVEFRHGTDQFKLITIDKLTIEGSYIGVLRGHVPRIIAVAAHVFVPAFGSNLTLETQHSTTVVDEIVATDSFVQFESNDPEKKPVRFDVHEASFQDVSWGSPFGYRLKFRNPEPPGEISVKGKFGPWTRGRPQETPFSGEYTFDQADLGVYGGVEGVLSSRGKFDGLLQHLNVSGTTDIPDFKVRSSSHKFKLDTRFDAYVDGLNGDTFLNRVDAHFGRTKLVVEGSIAGVAGKKGKFAELRLTSREGRIEDVLGLFVSKRAPMSGAISLRARADIPPGHEEFLQKVKLEGGFGIDDGSFSKPETQKNVNELSAGALGENKEDADTVVTDLKGQLKLTNGVAQFSDISFGIPGADARMHGTYNILTHVIDLHGQMRVDTKISKTATGVKALFLKVMDPIFKKKKKGEIVPVYIKGTYEKPQFGLDLASNKAPDK
jgi:AsmA-like protein